jgi:hypothetical protein
MYKSNATVTAAAYCSVCHSAGKSKAEYTSHFIRASKTPGAKVTCPYLLSITCGYCKGQGHTPKHCPVSKQNEQQQKQFRQQQHFLEAEARLFAAATATAPKAPTAAKATATKATATKATTTARNTFETLAILMEDEERIADRIAEHQKAFPAIAAPAIVAPAIAAPAGTRAAGTLTGWAKIAATKPTKPQPPQVAVVAVVETAKKLPLAKKNQQRDFTIEEMFDESNAEVAEYNRRILYQALEREKMEEEHVSWADIVD